MILAHLAMEHGYSHCITFNVGTMETPFVFLAVGCKSPVVEWRVIGNIGI